MSTAKPYREVSKSLAVRMVELLNALQILNDSISSIRNGRIHHLIVLSGQLRSLLTERSPKAGPLLFEIATLLGRDLELYSMPDAADPAFPEELKDEMLFHVSGLPLTVEKQIPAQQKISLESFLDTNLINLRGKHYSPRNLIEWYANKAGGSHYSRQLLEDFAALLEFDSATERIIGIRAIADSLFQIGDAVLTLGRNFVKSLTDLEFHMRVAIPPQSAPKQSYLYDARYPGTEMRFSVLVDALLVPFCVVTGLQGSTIVTRSDRLIDWSSAKHLHVKLIIQDDVDGVGVLDK